MEEPRETEKKIRKGIHLAWQSSKILQLRSVFLALSMQTKDIHILLNKGFMVHHFSHT